MYGVPRRAGPGEQFCCTGTSRAAMASIMDIIGDSLAGRMPVCAAVVAHNTPHAERVHWRLDSRAHPGVRLARRAARTQDIVWPAGGAVGRETVLGHQARDTQRSRNHVNVGGREAPMAPMPTRLPRRPSHLHRCGRHGRTDPWPSATGGRSLDFAPKYAPHCHNTSTLRDAPRRAGLSDKCSGLGAAVATKASTLT